MSEDPPEANPSLPPAGRLEQLSPLVRRLIAPNPGPMTGTGTCTYVIGRRRVAIIDPGPELPVHVERLMGAVANEEVAAILVTHTHRDHSPAARAVAAATGAPIVGCAPHLVARPPHPGETAGGRDEEYRPDRILADGETVGGPGWTLRAVATPGHTANHLAFALPQEKALFSGDHVMAWSTTVVIPPDGAMRLYMASLERLRGRDEAVYWPGHGGPVREPDRYLRALVHHRRQREAAIMGRLETSADTVPVIVEAVYPGLDPALVRPARLSVFAHLEWLVERGLVRTDGAATADAVYRMA